jgi:hypothetical protein
MCLLLELLDSPGEVQAQYWLRGGSIATGVLNETEHHQKPMLDQVAAGYALDIRL